MGRVERGGKRKERGRRGEKGRREKRGQINHNLKCVFVSLHES